MKKMRELILRILATFIISTVLILCFTVGIVGLQAICPAPCQFGTCPYSCASPLSDWRVYGPFCILTLMWISTIVFAIRAGVISASDKYSSTRVLRQECSYDLECLAVHSVTMLSCLAVEFIINISIVVGFAASGTNFSYSAWVWIMISRTIVAGGVIGWCWYPYGVYVKKTPGYDSVSINSV